MNGIFFSAIHVSTVRKLTLYSRATSRLVARLRGLLRATIHINVQPRNKKNSCFEVSRPKSDVA